MLMKPLLSTLLLITYTFFANAQAVMIQDLQPGSSFSWPGLKYVYKDKLIFAAHSGGGNYELHSYHYNDTSIKLEYDYAKGSMSWLDTRCTMAELNGKMYLGATCDTLGNELRMWDGVNPPVLVEDINPGRGFSYPANFLVHDNKLYFTAEEKSRHAELWVHDPASNTTRKISNVNGGMGSAIRPICLTVFKNKIYFSFFTSLHCYDPVQDTLYVAKNTGNLSTYDINMLSVCYDELYFSATSNDYGSEIYRYDGTNPPIRITDINPGKGNSSISGSNFYYTYKKIIGYKGAVYFNASSGSLTTMHLYKYEPGKALGPNNPRFVYNTQSGNGEFFEFEDKLYFSGGDSTHGGILWAYDGVNDPVIAASMDISIGFGVSHSYAIYNKELYFTAQTYAAGIELFKLGKGLNVKNVSKVSNLNVFPSPTTGMVNFEIQLNDVVDFTVRIIDISGRELYNSGIQFVRNGKNILQADISQLAAGNYMYHITTTNGVTLASGKVVKQ